MTSLPFIHICPRAPKRAVYRDSAIAATLALALGAAPAASAEQNTASKNLFCADKEITASWDYFVGSWSGNGKITFNFTCEAGKVVAGTKLRSTGTEHSMREELLDVSQDNDDVLKFSTRAINYTVEPSGIGKMESRTGNAGSGNINFND